MIYVVLGMHKSGTTLVSQILHHSGIAMIDGDDDRSYDQGNKYERQSVLALDMDILGCRDHDDILDLAPPDGPLADAHLDRMREIIAGGEAGGGDWGFKDPRSSLVHAHWERELPEHRIIAVYRHPAEIWKRFRWTGPKRLYRNFGLAWSLLRGWQAHNRCILETVDRRPRAALVIDYRELMTGRTEFARLCAFTGRDLVDRRRPDLYRSRQGMDGYLRMADRVLKMRRGTSVAGMMTELDRRRGLDQR